VTTTVFPHRNVRNERNIYDENVRVSDAEAHTQLYWHPEHRTRKVDGLLVTGSQIRIPVSMGSTESHQAGSEPSFRCDGSVAAIVNDGSASKPSASLRARHTVDEPSNPAVVAHSSRPATNHIVALAAVCPDVVTRQSQSQSLFEDSADQNAVPVRIEKAGLRYIVTEI